MKVINFSAYIVVYNFINRCVNDDCEREAGHLCRPSDQASVSASRKLGANRNVYVRGVCGDTHGWSLFGLLYIETLAKGLISDGDAASHFVAPKLYPHSFSAVAAPPHYYKCRVVFCPSPRA